MPRHLTEEERQIFLDWITESTKRAAHDVLRKFRNYALIGFVIIILGFIWVVHQASERSYQSRGVVCQIIKQGDYQAYQYLADGTINKKQLQRALKASVEYRKLLSPAKDCDTNYTAHANPNAPVKPNTGVAPRKSK